MIKIASITGSVLLIALLIFATKKYSTNKNINSGKDKMLHIEPSVFKTSSGWGYDILVDHKIFIHQEYIPSIKGKKYFISKEDALKMAGLIIEKILKTGHPAINQNDLAALKISY